MQGGKGGNNNFGKGQAQNQAKGGQKQGHQNSNSSQQQNQNVTNYHSLSVYQPFDLPTELELDLFKNWKEFVRLSSEASLQSERVNLLQRIVSQSDDMHKKMISGMIFGILVAPNQQSLYMMKRGGGNQDSRNSPNNAQNQMLPCDVILQDLVAIVRDNFDFATHLLFNLVMQNFDVFKLQTLERVLWLTETFMTKSVPKLKELALCLLQRISASSHAKPNQMLLNKALVEILLRHVDWVCSQPDRFPAIVFIKFLRQAEEHFGRGEAEKLLDVELKLCRHIWQMRQVQCIEAGRELIRIFSNHSNRPELAMIKEELSKSIQGKPLIKHLLEKRGNKQGEPNVYVQCLLNFEVQRRLEFMLTRLPEVNVQWHIKWLMEFAGIEFGKESESQLVDIVRYIVVNVTPTNEIIHSNVLQRFTLIGHLISQQKHHVHQSYVLQALFIDWLYYDEKQPDSIMLVEPGMLLMYRSADKHPRLTDMLVEYLYDYVNIYDPGRVDQAFQSVQKVFIDCESKGVVQSIKSYLINHPKLTNQTQVKLKKLYRGNQSSTRPGQQQEDASSASMMHASNLNLGQSSLQGSGQNQMAFTSNYSGGNAAGLLDAGSAENAADYDMIMGNEELNMSGQFSPPHEPEEPQGFSASGKLDEVDNQDIDSPYALDEAVSKQTSQNPAMLMGGLGQSQQQAEHQVYDSGINEVNAYGDVQSRSSTEVDLLSKPIGGQQQSQQPAQNSGSAYNIDLFSGEENKGKPSAGDAEMQDEDASGAAKQKKASIKKESESGSQDSSNTSNSNSSDDDDDDSDSNQDSEMQDEGATTTKKRPIIEVPASVIQRFFTKRESLTDFLQKMDQGTTHLMLDDLCRTYNCNESNAQELTELAYILYESFKDSLVQTDLVKILGKWKSLSFVHLLSYLQQAQKAENMQTFVTVANLIRSLAQFDTMFEVKLATHLLLESSQQPSNNSTCQQTLLNYANLFYSVGGSNPSATATVVADGSKPNQPLGGGQLQLMSVRRLLNESVLEKLVSSCQLKFLNYFMVAVVQELYSAYATENQQYLSTFITFCTPQSLQKLATSVRLGQVKLFETSLATSTLLTGSQGQRRQQNQQSNGAAGVSSSCLSVTTSYSSQQALWTLLMASLEQPESPILRASPTSMQALCPIEQLCAFVYDQVSALVNSAPNPVSATSMQSVLSASFLGLSHFTVLYNSLVQLMRDPTSPANESTTVVTEGIQKGFHAMLELYHSLDQLSNQAKAAAASGVKSSNGNLQAKVRPILRDVAQTILVCFFSPSVGQGNPAQCHRQLLGQLVQECDDVLKSEYSQLVRNKAFNRLKVAKDIFRSKLCEQIVEQSQLKAQVAAICAFQTGN